MIRCSPLLLLLLFHVVVVLELSLCMCNYRWITTTTILHSNNNNQTTNDHKNIEQYMLIYLFIVVVVIRSFVCNMKRPSMKQSMKCKWVQIWQANLLWLMDPPGQSSMDLWKTITPFGKWTYFGWWTPPVNWAWISARPLHWIIFITDWTLPPPPIDHRSMEDHYTTSVAWQTDSTTSSNGP